MGQKWYQSIAYDLPLGRLRLNLNFKGPRPFKFEKKTLRYNDCSNMHHHATMVVAAPHTPLQPL
jgi:hypothetical protein